MGLLEIVARVDAQVLGQAVPDRPIHRQRFGLVPGRGQSGHQARVHGLVERPHLHREPQRREHGEGLRTRVAISAAAAAAS